MANSYLHIHTHSRHDSPVNFAICNEIFDGWTLPDTFAYARKAGYDAVEIAPYTLAPRITDVSPGRRAEIRRQAADAGVAISGLHWLLARTEGLYLTHTDPTTRELTSNYFIELTRCTSDLGGRFMVLGSPKQRNLLPGVSAEQASQWTLDVLRPAVKLAESLGITLCFEPLAPTETNFINTALEARTFVARMNSRALQIILDVKAMSSEGRPIPEIIRESRGAFAYFHANDSNLKGPGFGDVDFVPIAAALRDVGYDGYVSVEVFRFEEGPEVIATQSRAYLKRAFGS